MILLFSFCATLAIAFIFFGPGSLAHQPFLGKLLWISGLTFVGLAIEEKYHRVKRAIPLIVRSCRFWWQRRTRGWDDSDLWNLDITIAKFVLPRLKAFQERTHGCRPGGLSQKEWDEKLNAMVYAMEYFATDKLFKYDSKESHDEQWKKVQHGLRMFANWFGGLWT